MSEFDFGDDCQVVIQQDAIFRHAKELELHAHGRYLEGEIRLPATIGECSVILSTIPSKESKQILHPNLLLITELDESSGKRKWKTRVTEKCWRLTVKVTEQRKRATLIMDKGIEKNVDYCLQNGKIILGKTGLLVTIITPLQSQNRGNSSGVRVVDVIRDRLMESSDIGRSPERSEVRHASDLAEMFTDTKKNSDAKLEMHRCRIKAEFADLSGSCVIGEAKRSDDIFNVRNKEVGALELHDMSDPRSSCSKAGFKAIVSSEFNLATNKKKSSEVPIRAVFGIEVDSTFVHAEKLYPNFNPISLEKECFQIHQNSLTFIVPEQDPGVIQAMKQKGEILKLALYRPRDQKHSYKKLEFSYVDHQEGYCPFCAIIRSHDSKIPDVRAACKGRKRRGCSGLSETSGEDSGFDPDSPADSEDIRQVTRKSPGRLVNNLQHPSTKVRRMSEVNSSRSSSNSTSSFPDEESMQQQYYFPSVNAELISDHGKDQMQFQHPQHVSNGFISTASVPDEDYPMIKTIDLEQIAVQTLAEYNSSQNNGNQPTPKEMMPIIYDVTQVQTLVDYNSSQNNAHGLATTPQQMATINKDCLANNVRFLSQNPDLTTGLPKSQGEDSSMIQNEFSPQQQAIGGEEETGQCVEDNPDSDLLESIQRFLEEEVFTRNLENNPGEISNLLTFDNAAMNCDGCATNNNDIESFMKLEGPSQELIEMVQALNLSGDEEEEKEESKVCGKEMRADINKQRRKNSRETSNLFAKDSNPNSSNGENGKIDQDLKREEKVSKKKSKKWWKIFSYWRLGGKRT